MHSPFPTLPEGYSGMSFNCPCLASDTLSVLPINERFQAYDDYDRAVMEWSLSRSARRAGEYLWRLDIRRALRHWRHYKAAVRKAQAVKNREAA